MHEAERIFLGLGSNLGDRTRNVEAAVEGIRALPQTAVVQVSTFHETEPWGITEQPEFVNAVAEITSGLEPRALLLAVKQLERELGRTETYRWGPRVIDIDLLLYGSRKVNEPGLTVPHPQLLNRPFVWEPLQEIAPEVLEELRRAALSV